MSITDAREPQPLVNPDTVPFVVGVGASAGGLKALEQFFENMPPDSGVAFVVIQHLSPDFKSLMNELLGRRTQMGIYKVEDKMVLKPNSVYLIPPGKNLVLEERQQLHLTDQQRSDGHPLNFPIDLFFKSIALHYAERSIGVVFSGTGSDGTRGLQDIHQAGGITLVQDPATAEFDGMPQSAIATGIIDQTASPDELAQIIYHLLRTPIDVEQFRAETNLLSSGPQKMENIIAILAKQNQFDFSLYKSNTVSRRIQRRCVMAGFNNLDDYIQLLSTTPEEQVLLRNDLLIGVTQFFRDRSAWDFLEQQVIPKLVAETKANTPIRIWVTACATGEEAYSMAILIHEAIERSGRAIEAKIFATDVHTTALEKAAQGIYPASIVNDLTEERLNRYFIRKSQSFEVSRQLRKMLIFAHHNLAKDASFTRMNLVSCRNALIYMQPSLQQRVLRHLHFSLNVQGILFLGNSETLADLEEEFKTLDKQQKIYQKLREVRLPLGLGANQFSSPITRHLTQEVRVPRLDPILSEAFKSFLGERNITGLIVDPRHQLLHVCSDPLKILQMPEGPATQDLTKMVPAQLQLPLTTALHCAQRNKQLVEYTGLKLMRGETIRDISLKVNYHHSSKLGKAFILVEFVATNQALSPSVKNFEADTEAAQRIMQLEYELQQTRENLQATIEELETTNEEQHAMNEELVASNEELQSTNEELHAVNEELYTVNAEYQSKIQELTELNDDIDNLLSSTDIGVIFLDSDMLIRKFTPAANRVLNLVDADVGRPLAHFSHNLDCPDLMVKLTEVMEGNQCLEQDVRVNSEEVCLLMRAHPYKLSKQEHSEGIVLTFVDISSIKQTQEQLQQEIGDRKQAEAALQALYTTLEQRVRAQTAALRQTQTSLNQKNAELSAIFRALPDSLVFANAQGQIQMVNPAFKHLFGYDSNEVVGELTEILYADYEDYVAQGQSRFNLTAGEQLNPYEVTYRNQDGDSFPGETVATQVKDEENNVFGFVSVVRDISDRKRAERQIQRQLMAIESATIGIAILDPDRYIYLNSAHAKLFGYDNPQELAGQSWQILYEPERVVQIEQEVFPQLLEEGQWQGEIKAKHKEGHLIDEELSLTITPAGDLICICQEITARKEMEKFQNSMMDALTRSNKDLEQFAYVASHDLREPLRKVKSFSELLVEGYQDQLDDTAQRYIGFMTSGVTRMEVLIEDLLKYSRLNQDAETLVPVDLDTSVRAVLNDLQLLIEEHQAIVITIDLPTVIANATAMQMLFLNLISNAIKFRGEEPPTIRISAQKQAQEWLISVQDNGIGMAPEFKERIFVIFQRLHSRAEYPGTGIGLALCRKIVENCGGRIWVDSEIDQGSTFYFTLPFEPPHLFSQN